MRALHIVQVLRSKPGCGEFCRQSAAAVPHLEARGIDVDMVLLSNDARYRRLSALATLRQYDPKRPHLRGLVGPFDIVQIYCHGLEDRISGLGHTAGSHLTAFAEALQPLLTRTARVNLWCCLTGAHPHAVATRLGLLLSRGGVEATILAHTTSGHTTRNPCLAEVTADPGGGSAYRTWSQPQAWRDRVATDSAYLATWWLDDHEVTR